MMRQVRLVCWLAAMAALALTGCKDNNPVDNYEHGNTQCSDGKDNDGDGLIDCNDPGCHGSDVCQNGLPDAGGPRDVQRLTDGPGSWGDLGDDPLLPGEVRHFFPSNPKNKIDLLVLVDNSDSMKEEQESLATAFPQIIDQLAQLPGGLPDLHIGVISSDLGAGEYGITSCAPPGGDGGRLQSSPRLAGCTAPEESYISHSAGTVNVPGSGDAASKIKDAFTCISLLGRNGCGFEQQLEALRLALDPQVQINPGFLRDDALLALLLVTDEDDCSAKDTRLYDPTQQGLTDPLGPLSSFRCFEFGTICDESGREPGPRHNCRPGGQYLHEVQDYISFFAGLKPPGQVMVAALSGPIGDPVTVELKNGYPDLAASCESAMGKAVPAIRLKAFVDAFAAAGQFNAKMTNICSLDFSPALASFGARIAGQLGLACLDPVRDTDAALEGIQPGCKVHERAAPGAPEETIPACNSAASACDPCPCWRTRPHQACAGVGDGLALEISRNEPAPEAGLVTATCLKP